MTNANTHKDMIPLKDLNLTSRFLFAEVMEDAQTQQDVLSIIFGREIPLLEYNESEKEFRVSPQIRSVRMDIFSMDEEKTVYATEMQEWRKSDLAKRSRYYQSLMDTSLLEPGAPNYNLLNQTYLIMIMTFDLFGHGKYQYTFRPKCDEVPDCVLNDGAIRIFLNTKGKNDNEVSAELVEFLHYVENTTDEAAGDSESERIRRIHERVCKVKTNEEMGVKYMHAWEEKYYLQQDAREAGYAEGRAAGHAEGCMDGERSMLRKLIKKKLEKGKSPKQIADELEAEIAVIRDVIRELEEMD